MPDAGPDSNDAVPASSKLSTTVKLLGLVSLCADVSSEMVYPVNPILLTRVLGAPVWALGLIEGIAECVASILKLYSGWLSDRLGRRKPFAVAGYAFGTVAKPIVGLAANWWIVLGGRFLDRFGKGLRTAPRDALIAESSTPDQRGRAFGLHRSLDTVGAVVGPLLGYAFLVWHPGQLRSLYLLAFVPGVLGVLLLARFVRERPPAARDKTATPRFTLSQLSGPYRRYLWIVALFGLGNSSDAFLLLRAQALGVDSGHLLLLYAVFNVTEAALGYFAGSLSDRLGRRPLVALGYIVFALVYFGFAFAKSSLAAWALFPIYGLYYTLTQGTQRALAADLAHEDRKGAELGAFHMIVGVSALPASVLAGWMYSHVAPASPFVLGGATASLSALLLLLTSKAPQAQHSK